MPDNIEQLQLALDFARGGAACDDLSRRVWGAWGAGRIRDDDAELLQARIARKRPKPREARTLEYMTTKVMRESGLDRQEPLSLRFETKHVWPDLRDALGVSKTGAAVAVALIKAKGWVSYSRHAEHYSVPARYKNPIYTRRKVIGAVDQLAAAGLVENIVSGPELRGWQSAMRASGELRAIVEKAIGGARLPLARPSESVILRDANGRPIDYRDNRKTDKMRRRMQEANEALEATPIAGCEVSLMARIFNESERFDRGGRAYPMGPSWQNMNRELRRFVEIAGEATIEADYKSIHPTLIYSRAGLNPPADAYDIGPAWEGLRPLVKRAVLILINAETYPAALGAIAHCDDMAELAEPGSPEATEWARKLIETIKARHKPIAHAFHSGAGAELQAIDGMLAEHVMHRMLQKGVTVLPVHDSFLCPASKSDLLLETMHAVAAEFGHACLVAELKV